MTSERFNETQLQCLDVSYRYGTKQALNDVTLNLGVGVTGLLGPNGAGKSTLMDIISTVRAPQEGSVHIVDMDVSTHKGRESARQNLGYLPQRFSLMAGSSALRNVMHAAWANGVAPEKCEQAALDALTAMGLEKKVNDKSRQLSGGQRQRLGIACAIAHKPSVLLLDEPTVGLDPAQRIDVRDHLHELGKTTAVLVSTHIVEDLGQMASNVVVLDEGRVVFTGAVDELANLARGQSLGNRSQLELGYLTLITGEGHS